MKDFLIGFIAAVMFILPNVAQADTLEDFKNILASKHFFVKYSADSIHPSHTYLGELAYYIYDRSGKKNQQKIVDDFKHHKIYTEAYDGNNCYIEEDNESFQWANIDKFNQISNRFKDTKKRRFA